MLKKTLSMLMALTMALGCSVVSFAQSGTDSQTSDSSAVTDVVLSAYADDDLTDAELADLEEEKEEVEEFAVENDDPQYGKYLDSLEAAEVRAETELLTEPDSTDSTAAASDEAYGGSDTLKYTNDTLIHNSKFDDMDKVYGVDVSYFQYDIDWKKVKADGIDFAIIRVGYRGYGTGTLVLDYKFKTNIEAAIDAGLEVGVYFYTQAINTTEAVEEAEFVIKNIKSYKDDIDLPVYYDIESVDYDTGRLDSANLSKSEKTALCKAFCDKIESSGYDAGVYANKYWLTSMIDGASLAKSYDIWLAHYTTYTTYTGTYNTWQFASTGKVNGINTNVDMDVDYREKGNTETIKSNAKVSDFKIVSDGSSATLSWSKVSGASEYIVYTYDSSSKKYTKVTSTKSTSASVTLSAESVGYCVRASFGSNTYGEYSDVVYACTNQVLNLTATTTSASISLKWDAVSGASGYEIYRATSPTGTFKKYSTKTSNSCKISGFTYTRGYSFKVRAYFTANDGTTSYGEYSAVCDAIVKPSKVKSLTHTASSSSSVTVSWKTIKSATGYQIATYDSSTKKYTVKATVTGNTTKKKVTGLSAGTEYKFAVRAYKTYNGQTIYGSYSAIKTCQTAPAAPQSAKASITSSSVTLTWNASTGASSYTVYKKVNNSFEVVGTTTSTTYKFTDKVSAGTTRSYKIKANSEVNGLSLASSYSSSCTIKATNLSKPKYSSYTATTSSITLKWKKVSGASGYEVYKYDPSTKTYVKLGNTSSLKYTVKSLEENTSYKFKIRAYKTGTNATIYSSYLAITKKTKS